MRESIVIVARTIMGQDYRCIGALGLESKNSLRILTKTGYNHKRSECPFSIGQKYTMEYIRKHDIEPPHTEDVLMQDYSLTGMLSNAQIISEIEQYQDSITWKGNIENIFNNQLTIENRKGFVAANSNLQVSTGFWCSDKALSLLIDEYGNKRYQYDDMISIKYTGDSPPAKVLPAGGLVRLSLSRWFDKDNDGIRRCHLQISGWYNKSNSTEKRYDIKFSKMPR